MKLLSRLTAVSAGLVLPVVALTGTAYAKLPPEDPDTRPGPVADDPVAPVVQLTGFATWQVVALVLTAALVAAVLTAVATHLRPAYAK
ncbi:hypothetical protein BWI15_37165 [Kribbella sp. ALI-6-A]|uniref:hypothetical protein n=1 Tax=Kribbella sp. ALI-6-A TaxID=1933817 RepID=UPI00097C5461|nr:hypothetical protein [Kribbella sp. ALI-6-A]ONI68616.1 hypothetical protein BWI15_37165 [Kribbella sp. ALI-6-A]